MPKWEALGGQNDVFSWDSSKKPRFRRFRNFMKNGCQNGIKKLPKSEPRAPKGRIFWILGGEIFIDVGMLSDKLDKDELTLFKWNGGFGITIATPLAPFRLDFAIPFDGTEILKIQM